MTVEPEERDASQKEEDRQVHRRLALPLLIPAVVFLFALLVIYGLSRIYLELNDFEVGEVSMATPLALGVALIILLGAWYLASLPRITRMHLASIFTISAALLTAGGIWAAVHEEEETGAVAPGPARDMTPAPEGGIQVQLVDPDFAVTVEPQSAAAGSSTFSVTNAGNLIHNFRLISSDLDPASLPVIEDEFIVDESAVEVIGSLEDFPAGQTQELNADLEAGSYVLICNVPSHYQSGMHTAFTVE